jgi:CoA:oxalate CoA-transferase
MLDCQLALLENPIMRYLTTAEVPGPLGSRHASIAPFQSFAAADGEIIIAAGNDELFVKLCRALDMPHLASDQRFATNPLRCQHVAELQAELETALREKTVAEWLERLDAMGIPAGPINRIDAAIDHPQVEARNMIVSVGDPRASDLRVVGNPMKFLGVADSPSRPAAPDIDQHRRTLLCEFGAGPPGLSAAAV